jgi:four helix bundle protein
MYQVKELNVWQKSIVLVKEIYEATQKLSKDELFGITSQLKRSADSIPANIAEGCGRNSDKELNRFLDIANGSTFELEKLIILCLDLKYFLKKEFESINIQLNEIQKMFFGLKQTIIKS